MRIGLDIHGTIDAKPKFFANFSQRIVSLGFECHVITGSRRTPEIEQQLKDFGIQYTHFFSIADHLLLQGKEVFWKDKDNPFFCDEDWNCVKANYCAEQKIDLMIDDSDEYGKFFKTLYMRVI
jgi:hypothetical protein